MKRTILSAMTLAALGTLAVSCTEMKQHEERKNLPPQELAVLITESVNELDFDDVAPYTTGSLKKAVQKHAENVPDMDTLKKAVKEKDVKTLVKAKAGMTGHDMTDKEAEAAAKEIKDKVQTDVILGEMEGFIASTKDMTVEVVGAEVADDFAEVACRITKKMPAGDETDTTVWYFVKENNMWYNVAEEDYLTMKAKAAGTEMKKATPAMTTPVMTTPEKKTEKTDMDKKSM